MDIFMCFMAKIESLLREGAYYPDLPYFGDVGDSGGDLRVLSSLFFSPLVVTHVTSASVRCDDEGTDACARGLLKIPPKHSGRYTTRM